MRLLAFQGLRYTAKAGEAGMLAAPPYDQIDDAARDRFHAASPFHFVHLTRPSPPDPYQRAAQLHRQWEHDGIIARDERPAIYPYVIQLADGGPGGRRLGVMGLAEYAPASVIRPHEQTLDKPLADRTALLDAMRVDLEPALLLAEDDGRLEELLAADLAGAGQPLPPALVDYRDAEGNHHLLFRLDDPARIAEYQRALASRPAAIADGHHRYKVGQLFAAAHPQAGAGPTAAGAKLAVISSIQAPALTIDPIHRALRTPVDLARLAAARTAAEPFHGTTGADLARAVATAPQPALGVWTAGKPPEIWHLATPAAGGTGAGAAAGQRQPLVVQLFQDSLLPLLGLRPEAVSDGTLVYRSNPDDLYAQIASGELGTGFWLPPMIPADFAAAIAHGDMLPPKSTRFLPKAMSGLVWSDHDSRVS
jgi:uncharacterized protein (DUF1015 family)